MTQHVLTTLHTLCGDVGCGPVHVTNIVAASSKICRQLTSTVDIKTENQNEVKLHSKEKNDLERKQAEKVITSL
jgi:hypothetical protein